MTDDEHRHEGPDGDASRESVYALYQRGASELAEGNATSAVELLERAVEVEPEKASLHEALGRAYFATSRVQRARGAFEAALELDPSDAFAHFGVGRCYERQGRLGDAAKHYKLACALADRSDYRRARDRVIARIERLGGA